MFCKNCGNQLSEGEKFCSNCGTAIEPVVTPAANNEAPVAASAETAAVAAEANSANVASAVVAPAPTPAPTPVVPNPQPPKKKKGKGKLIAIISAIVVVVLAAAGAVWYMITSGVFGNDSNNGDDSDDEKNDGKKSEEAYVEEVEAYLDYLVKKNDDVDDFVSDMYLFGEFGNLYSGKAADEVLEKFFETMFEQGKEESMGYGYYEYFDYDNWEDYVKEGGIDRVYENIEGLFGDWKLKYEIGDAKELDAEDVTDFWEGVIDSYEEMLVDTDFSRNDREDIEDFIDSLKDMEVEEAYEVEVEIEVDGDEDSCSNDFEFTVAKVGKEWVILDGPKVDGMFDAD